MINVLEEVVAQRQLKNDENRLIQLSSVFMDSLISSFKVYSNDESILNDEFFVVIHNLNYKIRNRAFRDDTNDPDVEEAILKLLNQKDNVTKNE